MKNAASALTCGMPSIAASVTAALSLGVGFRAALALLAIVAARTSAATDTASEERIRTKRRLSWRECEGLV